MDNAKEPEHLAIRKKRKGAPRRFRSHKRWKDVTIDDLPHAIAEIEEQGAKCWIITAESACCPWCFTPLWRANMTAPNAAIQHFRRGKKCIDTQDREDIRILALKQQNSLCWESITSLYNLDSSRFLDKENWISKVIPNYLPGMHPAPEMPQNETFANSSDASSSGRGTLSSTPLLSPTHYDSPSDSGVDGEDAHTSGGSLHRFRLSKRVPARSGGKRKADAGHSDTIRLAKKRFFDYTTDDFGANVAAARGRRKLDRSQSSPTIQRFIPTAQSSLSTLSSTNPSMETVFSVSPLITFSAYTPPQGVVTPSAQTRPPLLHTNSYTSIPPSQDPSQPLTMRFRLSEPRNLHRWQSIPLSPIPQGRTNHEFTTPTPSRHLQDELAHPSRSSTPRAALSAPRQPNSVELISEASGKGATPTNASEFFEPTTPNTAHDVPLFLDDTENHLLSQTGSSEQGEGVQGGPRRRITSSPAGSNIQPLVFESSPSGIWSDRAPRTDQHTSKDPRQPGIQKAYTLTRTKFLPPPTPASRHNTPLSSTTREVTPLAQVAESTCSPGSAVGSVTLPPFAAAFSTIGTTHDSASLTLGPLGRAPLLDGLNPTRLRPVGSVTSTPLTQEPDGIDVGAWAIPNPSEPMPLTQEEWYDSFFSSTPLPVPAGSPSQFNNPLWDTILGSPPSATKRGQTRPQNGRIDPREGRLTSSPERGTLDRPQDGIGSLTNQETRMLPLANEGTAHWHRVETQSNSTENQFEDTSVALSAEDQDLHDVLRSWTSPDAVGSMSNRSTT